MAATQAEIIALIDQWIRNYAPEAFHDQRLNMILKLMLGFSGGGSGGGTGTGSADLGTTYVKESADFANATDCPIPSANGNGLLIFYDEGGRHIWQADSEWSPLVGGGFTIDLPGFDSTTANFHFVITVIS